MYGDSEMPKHITTEENYKELQRNLVLYKEGNAEATAYICKSFHYFITKYAKFIKGQKSATVSYIGPSDNHDSPVVRYKLDPSLKGFVNLFIDAEKAKNKNASKPQLLAKACTRIYELFDRYEYDEIYNELILALLNMARKYKITQEGDLYHKENGTFHMYVQKCFHWEAFAYLKKLIKDPIVYCNFIPICDEYDDDEYEETHCAQYRAEDDKARESFEEMLEKSNRQAMLQTTDAITMKEKSNITPYDEDSLNFNWTNGVTCSEIFKDLTSFEREIIILYYVKNQTDDEIGQLYNMHRSSICSNRHKAVEKIKKRALKNNIIIEN